MPRPKVRPEHRQRTARACNSCKTSKIRCDSHLPCAPCIKRDRSGSCTYPGAIASSQSSHCRQNNHYGVPELGPPSAASPLLVSAGISPVEERRYPQLTFANIPSPREESLSFSPTGESVTLKDPLQDRSSPKDSFIPCSNGEKVFVGESSSLSFLHFLRQTLQPYVGATPFTTGERQDEPRGVDDHGTPCEDTNLTTEEKRGFIQAYFATTSALLDLFTPVDAETYLAMDSTRPLPDCEGIGAEAIDMVIAIGTQARARTRRERKVGTKLYAHTRRNAFESMVVAPNLDMVRVFILLAFYALGESQQNAAFVYLGVACRTAIVLGLHQPTSWDADLGQNPDSRLRVWHSLCTLDVLSSSIFGHPCTVPRATRHSLTSVPLDPSKLAFNAILKGAALLDDTTRTISRHSMIDTATAEALLELLRSWSQDVPESTRQLPGLDMSNSESGGNEQILNHIHVSGFYYYCVMLITRPFLIQYMRSKLDQKQQTHCTPTLKVFSDPKLADLAHVCIQSATYMGDLCHKTFFICNSFDLPLGNMFLFQTWVFGAGLVLGFCIFAGESRPDLEDAFHDLCHVLKKCTEANPRVKVYDETLQSLLKTSKEYRQQISRQTQQKMSLYIDQIHVVDSTYGENRETSKVNRNINNNTPLANGGRINSHSPVDTLSTHQADFNQEWFAQQDWTGMLAQVGEVDVDHDWNVFQSAAN